MTFDRPEYDLWPTNDLPESAQRNAKRPVRAIPNRLLTSFNCKPSAGCGKAIENSSKNPRRLTSHHHAKEQVRAYGA
jgi:hypothetical protein